MHFSHHTILQKKTVEVARAKVISNDKTFLNYLSFEKNLMQKRIHFKYRKNDLTSRFYE